MLSRNASPRQIDHRVAIVHLTFEGIQTSAGGVGTVIGDHLDAMAVLRRELRSLGIDIAPHFFDIAYAPQRRGYDAEHFQDFRSRLAQVRGRLGFLPNLTRGGNPGSTWGNPELGGLENWKVASAGGAAVSLNVAIEHDCCVMYAHDTVFALAPMYAALQASCIDANLYALYVVHATALTHESENPSPERLMAESTAVHFSKHEPRARLGVISEFMRQHLTTSYGAAPASFAPVGGGVNPFGPFYRQRHSEEVRGKLSARGIPTDRALLMTSGRAVGYKRHEDVLSVARCLTGKLHTVIHTYSPYEPVERAMSAGVEHVTVISAFDRELLACLCQWPLTKVVMLPSVGEPFGLIPSETRLLARNAGPVVALAASGGFIEQVHHGIDGFLFPPFDPDAAAATVEEMLELSSSQLASIRNAAVARVLAQYSVPRQILRTLRFCSQKVDNVGDEADARLESQARSLLAGAEGV